MTGVIALALLATACVGSVDREEFEQEVRERGGGIDQDLAIEAVAAVEDELGQSPVEFLSFTMTNELVTVQVRSPEFPDEFDSYVYRGDSLDGPDAVPTPPNVPPGQLVFSSDAVRYDRLNDMVDEAIVEAGIREAYAENVTISLFAGTPVVTVNVTNMRRDVPVQFGPQGRLLGVGDG